MLSKNKVEENQQFSFSKLTKMTKFRESFFTEDSRPSLNTLKKWCSEGVFNTKRLGDTTYIVLDDKVKEVFGSQEEEQEQQYQKEDTATLSSLSKLHKQMASLTCQ